MLGSTAIKFNVKSHRSGGFRYKADHCESTNVNKQKLLNNRCARDECSAYMHWRNMLHHIYYIISVVTGGGQMGATAPPPTGARASLLNLIKACQLD